LMRAAQEKRLIGELIANALNSSWRATPSEPDLSAEQLCAIVQLLLKSGSGSLAWWRIRNSHLRTTSFATDLHQAYLFHNIRVSFYERYLTEAVKLLTEAGVTPILAKGWAVARYYPEPGLRPYGDLDFIVAPEQYEQAREALVAAGNEQPVDLHCGPGHLSDRNFDQILARAERAMLDDVEILLPGPEDHARMLCLHLLNHGMWRPLWLCDIAAVLENVNSSFDWDYFIGTDRVRAQWIACTVRLAQSILGAEIGGLPNLITSLKLPRWLRTVVFRQWSVPFSQHVSQLDPMRIYLRQPAGVLRALRARWPNPIEASAVVGFPLNNFPRMPIQLLSCVVRTARFIKRGQLSVAS
jgi:hypothetical protein